MPSVIPRASISKVQFGILSEDDIRRLSVTEIDTNVIYKSGASNANGINDARLGTVNHAMLCTTCGGTMETCPGHIGHMVLAEPVFNVEFINYAYKVLSCVCFYCCRVLLPRDHAARARIERTKDLKKRLGALYDLSKRIRTCGKPSHDDHTTLCSDIVGNATGCGGTQPEYVKGEVSIRIRAAEGMPTHVSPRDLHNILKSVSLEDMELLGLNAAHAHPGSMMWSLFMIPPVSIRPSRSDPSNPRVCGEDDLTLRMRSIIKANSALGKTPGRINLVEGPVAEDDLARTEAYMSLQRNIAGYQNTKYQSGLVSNSDYGREKKSIRTRFTGKQAKKGRMRHTVCGKRMDFSARTVVTPDSNIDINEIGVPLWMCKVLTYPERVTRFNVHHLTERVRNGPDVYPGANFVIHANGERHSLKFGDRTRIVLRYGQTVLRHLTAEDWVLFNRQPSLHKMSLMAHRVRPMSGNSFRLHLACTKPYNADFDGDEMNMSVILDQYTRAEAACLLNVEQNLVKDGRPLVCFQQHSILAAYLLTAEDTRVPRRLAQSLIYDACGDRAGELPWSTISADVSGRDLFAACLPPDFCLRYKDVYIRNGVYLAGRLAKSGLNRGVVYTMCKDYGYARAMAFIQSTQLMLENFLRVRGSSISYSDCYVPRPPEVRHAVRRGMAYVNAFHDHLPSHTSSRGAVHTEEQICLVLDKCRDLVGDRARKIMESRGPNNGLLDMVLSGAKGNPTNIVQIAGMVGQQRNHHCARMSTPLTSMVNTGDHAGAHGMITRSFASGLRAYEYFNHLVASRVGLVDTAVKTSETGYCQRRIAKALEDITVRFDNTTRNSQNQVVQFVYGEDGFDSTLLDQNTIRVLFMPVRDVRTRHTLCDERLWPRMTGDAMQRHLRQVPTFLRTSEAECSTALDIRARLVRTMAADAIDDICLAPVNFEHMIERVTARRSNTNRTDLHLTDMTPLEALTTCRDFITAVFAQEPFCRSLKLRCLFEDWCSCATLWRDAHFTCDELRGFLDLVDRTLQRSRITPNESVGMYAAQNCSEPLTQMTLNRFHHSGQFTNLVSGVVRIKELVNATQRISAPSMRVYALPGVDVDALGLDVVGTPLRTLVSGWDNHCVDLGRSAECVRPWRRPTAVDRPEVRHLTIRLDRARCASLRVSPRAVATALVRNDVSMCARVSWSPLAADDPAARWWVTVSSTGVEDELWSRLWPTSVPDATVAAELAALRVYGHLVEKCVVRGYEDITDFYIDRDEPCLVLRESDAGVDLERSSRPAVVTQGIDLERIMCHPGVDTSMTTCNSPREIEEMFGIDAACAMIRWELTRVMDMNNTNVGQRHINLIADTMCFRGRIAPMTYQGICHNTTSVVKKASFEKAIDSFITGAVQAHVDHVTSPTECLVWNKPLQCGTGTVVTRTDVAKPSRPSAAVAAQHERELRSRGCRYRVDVSRFMVPYTDKDETAGPRRSSKKRKHSRDVDPKRRAPRRRTSATAPSSLAAAIRRFHFPKTHLFVPSSPTR